MIDEENFRSVLVPDPIGPGMYRLVEEYIDNLPCSSTWPQNGPPLRRAARKPTRGRPANQAERNQT